MADDKSKDADDRDKEFDYTPNEADRDPAIESLSRGEEEEAKERAGPRPPVVYASISARGMEELGRPTISLWGSGIAAGLILMVSVISEGLIEHELPDMVGKALIADIGYTLGFILVILGRLQLFTENTITPVLPLLANPTRRAFYRTGRLWAIVFSANMVGTMIAAVMLVWGDIVTDAQISAILDVSSKVMDNTPFETLRYGIIAGFLIATLVWCMPTARGAEFFLIFFVTYVIALGNFTHVVAGSGEGFMLMLTGTADPLWVVFGLILPAFVGNVLGGTVLFATLAYVQVMEEIHEDRQIKRHGPLEKAPRPRSEELPGERRF